jgi:hypothetical protein
MEAEFFYSKLRLSFSAIQESASNDDEEEIHFICLREAGSQRLSPAIGELFPRG